MTREEAAKMIKDDIRLHHDYLSGKYRHALNLAIQALEQPEIIRCEECMYRNNTGASVCWLPCMEAATGDYWFCGSGKRAERREE